MKSRLILLLCICTLLTSFVAICENETQGTFRAVQNQEEKVQQKLINHKNHKNPWRWYHYLGVILVTNLSIAGCFCISYVAFISITVMHGWAEKVQRFLNWFKFWKKNDYSQTQEIQGSQESFINEKFIKTQSNNRKPKNK